MHRVSGNVLSIQHKGKCVPLPSGRRGDEVLEPHRFLGYDI